MIGGSIALVASEYILARQNAMTKVAMLSVIVLFVLSGVSVIRGGENCANRMGRFDAVLLVLWLTHSLLS